MRHPSKYANQTSSKVHLRLSSQLMLGVHAGNKVASHMIGAVQRGSCGAWEGCAERACLLRQPIDGLSAVSDAAAALQRCHAGRHNLGRGRERPAADLGAQRSVHAYRAAPPARVI